MTFTSAHAEPKWYSGMIDIFLYEKRPNRITFLSEIVMTTVEEGTVMEPTPISLPRETAQELMDSLWQCGLRPSEGSGSAGSLKATENHLADMQEITNRLMAITEKHFGVKP